MLVPFQELGHVNGAGSVVEAGKRQRRVVVESPTARFCIGRTHTESERSLDHLTLDEGDRLVQPVAEAGIGKPLAAVEPADRERKMVPRCAGG